MYLVCGRDKLSSIMCEDIWEQVLCFYYVGPGDDTQIIRLDDKCFYLLSHFIGSSESFFTKKKKKQKITGSRIWLLLESAKHCLTAL